MCTQYYCYYDYYTHRAKFSNFYLLIRWKIKRYFSNNEKFWPFGLHKGHKAKKWNTNFALNYYFPNFSLLCLYYIASGQIHFSKTWKSTQLTTAPSAMSSKQMSSEKWSSISPFLRKFCSVMSTQIKVPEHWLEIAKIGMALNRFCRQLPTPFLSNDVTANWKRVWQVIKKWFKSISGSNHHPIHLVNLFWFQGIYSMVYYRRIWGILMLKHGTTSLLRWVCYAF